MLWLAYANIYFGVWLAVANSCGPTRIFCFLTLGVHMNLMTAQIGNEYTIQRIATNDDELNAFLFSLGCYSGEPITVISRRKGSCIVSIKDGRYSIDNHLAEAIIV